MRTTVPGGPARYEFAACSDVGRVRSRNEDVVEADARNGFMVLADGMGGHDGGDVAASITVRVMGDGLRALLSSARPLEELVARVFGLVENANKAVLMAAGSDARLARMGSTLVFMAFVASEAVCANVGDSRAYRLRAGMLARLSHDHTVLQQLRDRGMIKDCDAACRNAKSDLTQAIGVEPDVLPDLAVYHVCPGDVFLLCSDGLSDLLSEDEIGRALALPVALERRAQLLVDMANACGGSDNVSCVLAQPVYSDLV